MDDILDLIDQTEEEVLSTLNKEENTPPENGNLKENDEGESLSKKMDEHGEVNTAEDVDEAIDIVLTENISIVENNPLPNTVSTMNEAQETDVVDDMEDEIQVAQPEKKEIIVDILDNTEDEIDDETLVVESEPENLVDETINDVIEIEEDVVDVMEEVPTIVESKPSLHVDETEDKPVENVSETSNNEKEITEAKDILSDKTEFTKVTEEVLNDIIKPEKKPEPKKSPKRTPKAKKNSTESFFITETHVKIPFASSLSKRKTPPPFSPNRVSSDNSGSLTARKRRNVSPAKVQHLLTEYEVMRKAWKGEALSPDQKAIVDKRKSETSRLKKLRIDQEKREKKRVQLSLKLMAEEKAEEERKKKEKEALERLKQQEYKDQLNESIRRRKDLKQKREEEQKKFEEEAKKTQKRLHSKPLYKRFEERYNERENEKKKREEAYFQKLHKEMSPLDLEELRKREQELATKSKKRKPRFERVEQQPTPKYYKGKSRMHAISMSEKEKQKRDHERQLAKERLMRAKEYGRKVKKFHTPKKRKISSRTSTQSMPVNSYTFTTPLHKPVEEEKRTVTPPGVVSELPSESEVVVDLSPPKATGPVVDTTPKEPEKEKEKEKEKPQGVKQVTEEHEHPKKETRRRRGAHRVRNRRIRTQKSQEDLKTATEMSTLPNDPAYEVKKRGQLAEIELEKASEKPVDGEEDLSKEIKKSEMYVNMNDKVLNDVESELLELGVKISEPPSVEEHIEVEHVEGKADEDKMEVSVAVELAKPPAFLLDSPNPESLDPPKMTNLTEHE
ncbi:hypothetical protein PCE1_004483 [Barthelona sp. PCE]